MCIKPVWTKFLTWSTSNIFRNTNSWNMQLTAGTNSITYLAWVPLSHVQQLTGLYQCLYVLTDVDTYAGYVYTYPGVRTSIQWVVTHHSAVAWMSLGSNKRAIDLEAVAVMVLYGLRVQLLHLSLTRVQPELWKDTFPSRDKWTWLFLETGACCLFLVSPYPSCTPHNCCDVSSPFLGKMLCRTRWHLLLTCP